MTVTNESGGRLNAFANEPEIEVITSKANYFMSNRFFKIALAFTLISIIGIFLISK